MSAQIGQPAPAFSLTSHEGDVVDNDALKGRKAVVVFIPFPFTGICTGEACELRDNLGQLEALDANVVIITCHAGPTNKEWASQHDLPFPILSDFWPHGDVTRAFGTFNETLGAAMRSTYILDAEGVVRDIIATDSLRDPRQYAAYPGALAAIG